MQRYIPHLLQTRRITEKNIPVYFQFQHHDDALIGSARLLHPRLQRCSSVTDTPSDATQGRALPFPLWASPVPVQMHVPVVAPRVGNTGTDNHPLQIFFRFISSNRFE